MGHRALSWFARSTVLTFYSVCTKEPFVGTARSAVVPDCMIPNRHTHTTHTASRATWGDEGLRAYPVAKSLRRVCVFLSAGIVTELRAMGEARPQGNDPRQPESLAWLLCGMPRASTPSL